MKKDKVIKFANQGMHQGDERYYIVPSVVDISEMVNYLPKGDGKNNILSSMIDKDFRTTIMKLWQRISSNFKD